MESVIPFLKWAGGKRWFVQQHASLFPVSFNRYIEPFLGSGAVFFFLSPRRALLGDSNLDLIETYKAIQDNWELVFRYLREHQRSHTREHYYQVRASRPRSIYARAARFIYLNRTCWNGLYRVNQQGEFNVPIGTKSSVVFPYDQFGDVSNTLKDTQLLSTDFEDLIDVAGENDFIFVDPPYTVRHNHNAFVKYNEKLFSWFDQERLFYALKRAKNRGAKIVGTNACHKSVQELYGDTFESKTVMRHSAISSKVATRKSYEELVFFTENVCGKSNG